MRISIRTKKRHLIFTSGEDSATAEAVEYIQMHGGDFDIAPDGEAAEDGGDELVERGRSFGFAPRTRRFNQL